MKISKSSWHYRFNDIVQTNFGRSTMFTTCTYIRTTLRSVLQGLSLLALCGFVLTAIGCMIGSAIYFPIALGFGLAMVEFVGPFAVITYGSLLCAGGIAFYENYLKDKLEARREQKMSLLRQAVLDRKEGICTIVEFE